MLNTVSTHFLSIINGGITSYLSTTFLSPLKCEDSFDKSSSSSKLDDLPVMSDSPLSPLDSSSVLLENKPPTSYSVYLTPPASPISSETTEALNSESSSLVRSELQHFKRKRRVSFSQELLSIESPSKRPKLPGMERLAKERARKKIKDWCNILLQDRFKRPSRVVTSMKILSKSSTHNSSITHFRVTNHASKTEMEWKKKVVDNGPTLCQEHIIKNIYLYEQSGYVFEKHVPGTHVDPTLREAKKGYTKSQFAPSISRLNRAHLVQRMMGMVPLHPDTTVSTSAHYNQVVMRAEERKLNNWCEDNGIKLLNASIKLELIKPDATNFEFQVFVRQIFKDMPEHASYLVDQMAAYIKSINLPILKSCELHFDIDEKDPVYSKLGSHLKKFTINLPPDYQFALRRNYTGDTPASDRYSQLATPKIKSRLLDLSQHSPFEEANDSDNGSPVVQDYGRPTFNSSPIYFQGV